MVVEDSATNSNDDKKFEPQILKNDKLTFASQDNAAASAINLTK